MVPQSRSPSAESPPGPGRAGHRSHQTAAAAHPCIAMRSRCKQQQQQQRQQILPGAGGAALLPCLTRGAGSAPERPRRRRRDRGTGGQRDRGPGGQSDRGTEGQRDRETERPRDRGMALGPCVAGDGGGSAVRGQCGDPAVAVRGL